MKQKTGFSLSRKAVFLECITVCNGSTSLGRHMLLSLHTAHFPQIYWMITRHYSSVTFIRLLVFIFHISISLLLEWIHVYTPLGQNCHNDYGGYIHEVNYYIHFLNCFWFLTVTEQISFSDAGRTYSSVLNINSLTHISPILPHFQRL